MFWQDSSFKRLNGIFLLHPPNISDHLGLAIDILEFSFWMSSFQQVGNVILKPKLYIAKLIERKYSSSYPERARYKSHNEYQVSKRLEALQGGNMQYRLIFLPRVSQLNSWDSSYEISIRSLTEGKHSYSHSPVSNVVVTTLNMFLVEVEVEVNLTDSRPVRLGIGPPFGTLDQILSCSSFFCSQLLDYSS
jgi:hypothetical protein